MKFCAALYTMTDFSNDTIRFFEALQAIKDCGFDRVMLLSRQGQGPVLTRGHTPDGCLLNLVESDLDLVEGQLMRAGVAPRIVFAAGMTPAETAAADDDRTWLRSICRATEQLGCHHVGHSVGRAEQPGMDTDDKCEQIQCLASLVGDIAAEFPQLQFGADVHYQGTLESVEDCELYLQELTAQNAGILLNMGHLSTCAQPGWELAQKYPDRTPICAWKDHTDDPEGKRPFVSVQLGTGDTPLEKYVEAIKPQLSDRAHVIAVEGLPPDERAPALKKSREYLEDIWDRTQVNGV